MPARRRARRAAALSLMLDHRPPGLMGPIREIRGFYDFPAFEEQLASTAAGW